MDIKLEESLGDAPPGETSDIRVLHPPVITDISHQGNGLLNHHTSLWKSSFLSSPLGLAVLLPCLAVDLPYYPNIFVPTISSPRAQPITTDISPKRHQSLSKSFVSPWGKLTAACVSQLFRISQRITNAK